MSHQNTPYYDKRETRQQKGARGWQRSHRGRKQMAVTYVLKPLANQHPVVPDGIGACWEVTGHGLVAAAKSQLSESQAWVTQGRRRKKAGIAQKTGHRPINGPCERDAFQPFGAITCVVLDAGDVAGHSFIVCQTGWYQTRVRSLWVMVRKRKMMMMGPQTGGWGGRDG